jgi:TFIIF-interacting CTD phosphatase-like protein
MHLIPGQRNNNKIILNRDKALEIENQIMKKLNDEKKLILILDLDNTLIHTNTN